MHVKHIFIDPCFSGISRFDAANSHRYLSCHPNSRLINFFSNFLNIFVKYCHLRLKYPKINHFGKKSDLDIQWVKSCIFIQVSEEMTLNTIFLEQEYIVASSSIICVIYMLFSRISQGSSSTTITVALRPVRSSIASFAIYFPDRSFNF